MDTIMNFFKPKNNVRNNVPAITTNNTRKNNNKPINVNIPNSVAFPEPTTYSGGRRRRRYRKASRKGSRKAHRKGSRKAHRKGSRKAHRKGSRS
jgi:hypothetical protein